LKQVIPLIDTLHAGLTDVVADTSNHPAVWHAVQRGISALNKYYSLTDDSYIARFALFLHPTFKTDYMRHQEWPDSWIEQALSLIRQVWKADYAPRAQVPASTSTTTEPRSGGLYDFNRYCKEKRVTATSDAIDQLEAYLAQDSFHVDDPLAYW
ncbi:hypothetical protein BOTBODRAFT_98412, partial [Botryobasidium botryosum FD-172 SS1]